MEQKGESFWSIVVSKLRREPQEIPAIRRDGTAGRWFSASVEDGVLVIDNATINQT
jgi:hypothetical protein